MKLDVSKFCWKFEKKSPHRLCLYVFCAPGLANTLRLELPRHWGFIPHSEGSIVCNQPEGIRLALRGIEGDDETLMSLLDTYVQYATQLKRGKKQPEPFLLGLRSTVRAILDHTVIGTARFL